MIEAIIISLLVAMVFILVLAIARGLWELKQAKALRKIIKDSMNE